LRLLAWNILHGGGARLPRIVEEIAAYDPDVVALTGYRTGPGVKLCEQMRERDWPFVETSNPSGVVNGVAVFSRLPVRRRRNPAPRESAFRWVDLDLPEHGFGLAVLQIPAATNAAKRAEKTRFWDAVLRHAEGRVGEPTLFCGAWNTGLHRIDESGNTYICSEHFARLSTLGWTDLWRRFHSGDTEWTWCSPRGNGFRVDHAFASPGLLPRVTDCRYAHAPRKAKISDHSMVIVDIE
jgi:exodeoxyribonuclease III